MHETETIIDEVHEPEVIGEEDNLEDLKEELSDNENDDEEQYAKPDDRKFDRDNSDLSDNEDDLDDGPREAPLGEAVERHLPSDFAFTQWVQDPERLKTEASEAIETREVLEDGLETIKFGNVVAQILFETGVAQIPDGTV